MMTLPELKSRRLVLRPLTADDASAIAQLGGKDFEIVRWLSGVSWPFVEGETEAYLKTVVGVDPLTHEAAFAITLGGVFIGVVSVIAPGDLDELPNAPSIGYWIGRAFQGHGYASEAVETVLEWGFDVYKTDAIGARAFEENTRSRGLLRKFGFKPYAMTERYAKALDRKVSNVVVCLERSDYEARRQVA
ncbi:GNAT family N-acetyltransferase [Alphaproteobacteria bacterium AO1-B]|nr:GNAT family N-acetyltransferase [Alphaproteobacteria bacterium AO1-B]